MTNSVRTMPRYDTPSEHNVSRYSRSSCIDKKAQRRIDLIE